MQGLPRIVGLPVTEKKKRGRGLKGFDQGKEILFPNPRSVFGRHFISNLVSHQAGAPVQDRSCISVLLATSPAAAPFRGRRHSRGLIITVSDSRWDSETVN